MNKLNKWIAKHTFLTIFIATIIFWLCGIVLITSFVSFSFWWIAYFVSTFLFALLGPSLTRNYLINKAVKILENFCDPYPLLQETNEQLSYIKSKKNYKILLTINKSAAIVSIGDYKTNLRILENINIEEYHISDIIKTIYYSNLADAYLRVKDYENAKKHLELISQMISQLKNEKNKHTIRRIYCLNSALLNVAEGNFEAAVALINSTDEMNASKNMLVSKSLLWAQIYMGYKNFNQAVQCLNYVICNGNRLYAVTEASNLLTEIRENIMKNTF